MQNRILSVTGIVTAMTYPGYQSRPEVTVTVDVEGTALQLVFQSRRTVNCIDIGQVMKVQGAVVKRRGVPCIYNPIYTIVRGHDA
ncbi:hypothetical protein JTE88_03930 [Arcanobacterium phocisimile]|uniref:ATP-dependent DNA helicase RecG n=1 Tax=Arcanobacterium phocisimile TaxID=1302235 RepID=A0ABX7IIR8_9ACTO|nr:hypothetical protein [Arcanobacterium phocisimile]QRV02881.1 hypothetical protein JTE88_03930 [Arcanobacterium phocisimile]